MRELERVRETNVSPDTKMNIEPARSSLLQIMSGGAHNLPSTLGLAPFCSLVARSVPSRGLRGGLVVGGTVLSIRTAYRP